ncbi:uncharacterized protein F5Z01DRAFT_633311 [Emericellopsis atlantica]|uniref:CCCH zinc finger and RRM domain protein n=1 Tax=Emericellopsis atlantica TaxID=2614577 RepID=A0A9P7ZS77_9HYPO|nr:uncharacterized protein F5Z01DRAFT_633311 [Emericellopsis atlantica]KAG9257363.1 hypothetical protein F5Z01DRAFT_633311 [Emericellopsis atlantica]
MPAFPSYSVQLLQFHRTPQVSICPCSVYLISSDLAVPKICKPHAPRNASIETLVSQASNRLVECRPNAAYGPDYYFPVTCPPCFEQPSRAPAQPRDAMMLFPEEDAPLLKKWVVKRLENTSDADADVLADYIMALLKHEGTKEDVRALCEQELPVFLNEDIKVFLDDVFQAIAWKLYVPGMSKPPPSRQTGNESPVPPQEHSGPRRPQGKGRKRGYRDLDAPTEEGEVQESRPFKNARINGQGGDMESQQENGTFHPMPLATTGGPYDPQDPMGMGMLAMGMPFSGMPGQWPNTGRNSHRRRKRCREFDTKGFCARGNNCKFEHILDPNYWPQMLPQVPGLTGGAFDEYLRTVQFAKNAEEYDPNSNAMPGSSYHHNQSMPALPLPQNGRHKQDGRGGQRKKKGRAAFSAEGPESDKTKSTLVVESIPEDHLNEEDIRAFFGEFGTIEELTLQPTQKLAIIKYDNWESANAAYKSPKAIFDNRFVKVFWYKDEINPPHGAKSNGAAETGEEAQEEFQMDPEEFERRQQEAQAKWQEREAKRAELEQQRQDLERRQQEHLEKYREATEKLTSKMVEKNGGSETEVSGTEKLRAQLARLEQEAKILGIDTDGAADDASVSSFGPPHPSRGGWRGRGRGRGRGTWRGRGGGTGVEGRHAAYAQYSLDLRPKTVAIAGVDFTAPEKDEALRHYLLNLGEFDTIETSPDVTQVSFRDRKTAETFFSSLHGRSLPDVEGTLQLSWSAKRPNPVTAGRPLDRGGGVGGGEGGGLLISSIAPEEKGSGGQREEEREEGEVTIGDMDDDYADDQKVEEDEEVDYVY